MADSRGNRKPTSRAGRPAPKARVPPKAKRAAKSAKPTDDRFAKTKRPEWGGVARRGARQVLARPDDVPPGRPSREPERGAPAPWQPDEWVRESAPVRERATKAVARGDRSRPAGGAPRKRRKAPAEITAELTLAIGERRAPRAEKQLMDAARALERGAALEAWRILRPLAEQAPNAAGVRELAGLTLYRLERWKPAVSHLEAFVRLTGSVEQHPVLADSYRALGRHAKVAALWDELRQASPEPELVTEGRIVMAGSLADRGELQKAVALLEKGPVDPKRPPARYHLRLWYALADLYERAGDAPRARQLFARVAAVDPSLADTAERLQALA